jgi:hypothetical protein
MLDDRTMALKAFFNCEQTEVAKMKESKMTSDQFEFQAGQNLFELNGPLMTNRPLKQAITAFLLFIDEMDFEEPVFNQIKKFMGEAALDQRLSVYTADDLILKGFDLSRLGVNGISKEQEV